MHITRREFGPIFKVSLKHNGIFLCTVEFRVKGAVRTLGSIATYQSRADAAKLRMANNREYSDGRENTNQGVTLEWEILRAGCLAWMALAVEHHRQSDKSFLVPSSD